MRGGARRAHLRTSAPYQRPSARSIGLSCEASPLDLVGIRVAQTATNRGHGVRRAVASEQGAKEAQMCADGSQMAADALRPASPRAPGLRVRTNWPLSL